MGAAIILGLCTACLGQAGDVANEQNTIAAAKRAPWLNEQYVQEYYAHEAYRGRIELDVHEQMLTFELRRDHEQAAFSLHLKSELPRFIAVTFTQADAKTLFVGGYDPIAEEGAMAEVVFDPLRKLARMRRITWKGPRFGVASSVDVFPDDPRVAMLDHMRNQVLVYDPRSGEVQKVADSSDDPALAKMRYVHTWPMEPEASTRMRGVTTSEQAKRGVQILAATVDEAGMSTGRLAGRMVRIVDADGDGHFETVR